MAIATHEAHGQMPRKRRRALVVPLEAHRARAFRAAHRHSRMVRIMRIFLPAASLCVFAVYVLTSNITISIGNHTASVAKLELDGDSLRMVNPKMEGATEANGKYSVTADFAEQDISDPSTMRLNRITAQTTDAKKVWSRLTAPRGIFYSKAEKLDLFEAIEVSSSNGLAASLKSATINMKTQVVRTQDPVVVRMLNGTVHAHTMELDMKKRRVIFRHQVKVHMRKKPSNKTAKAGE